MTDLIMLATLCDGPKHGYQLKKQAGLIFGQGTLHNNLVYPLLRRFMVEGWVSRKTVPGERGQARQQYSITAAGRRTLIERLSQFDSDTARSPDQFRVRVGLFGLLPREARGRILAERAAALQQQDQNMAQIQKAIPLDVYPGEVIGFMRSQIADETAWIRRLQRIDSKFAVR